MHRSVKTIGPITLGAAAYIVVFLLHHALYRTVYSPANYGQPRSIFAAYAVTELLGLLVPIACGATVAWFEKQRPMVFAFFAGLSGALISTFFFSWLGPELAGPNATGAAGTVTVSVIYQAILCALASGAAISLQFRKSKR
jgi:hypothetical protein